MEVSIIKKLGINENKNRNAQIWANEQLIQKEIEDIWLKKLRIKRR